MQAPGKIYTIGIAGHTAFTNQVLEGFREGMPESGYVEGKNVNYIYCSRPLDNNDQIIDAELKKLLAQNIDMLLTAYNETALRAKKAVEGTDIPVLATVFSRPVEMGLVKTLSHPEGSVTGVQVADTMSKALELLGQIIPHTKKIYLPYNPDDPVSILYLYGLNKTASRLGIELVLHKVHSVEEAVTTIEGLPNDVDAIYRIPSPTLSPRNRKLSQAAIKRGLPMGSGTTLDEAALITFAAEPYNIGKQAARLAHQIRQGAKPADLPMETSEAYLTINLKTAEKIGLKIPDSLLLQAKTIIH